MSVPEPGHEIAPTRAEVARQARGWIRPDHLRERSLRPILTGEATWCQLFSEPSAGSDLAGLTTRSVPDGEALGRPPGAEGSIGKLASSAIARVHGLIGGTSAMLTGPESAFEGVVAEVLVSVPAESIAGGTDEVQRNILGERILGLPREPTTDHDRPFRDVLRNG